MKGLDGDKLIEREDLALPRAATHRLVCDVLLRARRGVPCGLQWRPPHLVCHGARGPVMMLDGRTANVGYGQRFAEQ